MGIERLVKRESKVQDCPGSNLSYCGERLCNYNGDYKPLCFYEGHYVKDEVGKECLLPLGYSTRITLIREN